MKARMFFTSSLLLSLALLVALLFTLGVYAQGGQASTPPTVGQAPAPAYGRTQMTLPYTTLVGVGIADPVTLDPHWGYLDTPSNNVTGQVYETLLSLAREDPAIWIPQLSTGWQVSPDGLAYTFAVPLELPAGEEGLPISLRT